MGLLAIDIETSSPFEEPPRGENSTKYFEWVITSVAYQDESHSELDCSVLFRRGGWGNEFTADMLEQLIDWCEDLEIHQMLTYNGAWFDLKHIGMWAKRLEYDEIYLEVTSDLSDLFANHIDLAQAAADHYSDELWESQEILPDWKAYQLAGINNERIWYGDYEFDEAYLEGLNLDSDHVKGSHIGTVLGEEYIKGLTHGLEETRTHQELEQLLIDYAKSDVSDLFDLYEALGGKTLYPSYHYPLEEVVP